MNVLAARRCVPTLCVPGAPGGQKEVFYHLELELTDGFELSCGCWELDLGPLEEEEDLSVPTTPNKI